MYMDDWNDSVDDADGSYVEMNHIATEKNAFYESFDCEAGKTYYIIMHDIYLCTDDTYEERVYNENATLSIAYYLSLIHILSLVSVLLTSVKQLSFGIEKQECQSIMQSFGSAVVHLNTAIP